MYVQQAPPSRGDPQATLSIAKQPVRLKLPNETWQLIGVTFAAGKSLEATARAYQQLAIVTLVKARDTVCFSCKGVEFRPVGLP
jgi:hypothetical protein